MNFSVLDRDQKSIRRRILEISFRNGFSHLGSCLSAADIICAVYKVKKREEKFVLSNGHAAVALYAVLESRGLMKASKTERCFIHPDRDPKRGIDVSTGSLGHGLAVALGMALADKNKAVYCVISDGECAEGSIWEALRVGLEQKAFNFKIIVNANGWSAYNPISLPLLKRRMEGFGYKLVTVNGHNIKELTRALKMKTSGRPLIIFAMTEVGQFPFLKDQDAHYYVMSENDYKLALKYLE